MSGALGVRFPAESWRDMLRKRLQHTQVALRAPNWFGVSNEVLRSMDEVAGSKAAISARISLDKRTEGAILDGQIDLCRQLAEDQGLTVVREYREPDVTGAPEQFTAKK